MTATRTPAARVAVVLSALGHPSELMMHVLAQLFSTLAPEDHELYLTMIMASWPPEAKTLLEAQMNPELAARLKQIQYDVGLKHGREEALRSAIHQLALAKGLDDSELEAKLGSLQASALLRVVTALGLAQDRDQALAAFDA